MEECGWDKCFLFVFPFSVGSTGGARGKEKGSLFAIKLYWQSGTGDSH